jgi:hypothetical protein
VQRLRGRVRRARETRRRVCGVADAVLDGDEHAGTLRTASFFAMRSKIPPAGKHRRSADLTATPSLFMLCPWCSDTEEGACAGPFGS